MNDLISKISIAYETDVIGTHNYNIESNLVSAIPNVGDEIFHNGIFYEVKKKSFEFSCARNEVTIRLWF